MLAAYQNHMPKPNNKAELKVVLKTIWDSLSQDSINKAVLGFRKWLGSCVKADGTSNMSSDNCFSKNYPFKDQKLMKNN